MIIQHKSALKVPQGGCRGLNFKHMKRARQISFDTQGDVYVRVPSDN